MRSNLIFLGFISLMLLVLAVAGHDQAITAPSVLKPESPLTSKQEPTTILRGPAAIAIEPVSPDELIETNR